MSEQDIFVVKANFNSDVEIAELSEHFHERFGYDQTLLALKCNDGEEQQAYWASQQGNLVVELNQLLTTSKPESIEGPHNSIKLYASSVDYNSDYDTYIYHTGIKIANLPDGVFPHIKPSDEVSDAYLANYSINNENGDYSEILLFYKNRTAWTVRLMLDDWEFMKSVAQGYQVDRNASTGETVDGMKSKMAEERELIQPMNYKPFEVGEVIGELRFLNVPSITAVWS